MELPSALRTLSDARLTEILRACSAIQEARVIAFEASQIGTFSSELWRLRVRYDRAEPSAPQWLVAKCQRKDPRARSGNGFATEIHFYENIAPRLNVRLPRMYYGHHDEASGEALMLLDYVEGIVPVSFIDGVTAAHSARALAALASMHAQWWGKVGDLTSLPHLADPALRSVIADAYDRGWQASREFFEAGHDPAFVAIGDALVGHVEASIAPLGAPATLLHGDAHFENLALLEESREHGENVQDVLFHDWAAVRRGHAAFDVAVFSVQSYPTDARRREQRRLVESHANAVRAASIEWKDPWTDYRRGVLYWVIHMLRDAALRPGARPWIVIDRYVAAAVDLNVGELIL